MSTSANDAAAGTGIRSLHVHYLDSTLTPQVLTVVPTGLAPITLPATDIRFVQKIHALAVGALNGAAGDITINFAGGTLQMMKAGHLESRSCFRMVPKGKVAFVHDFIGGSISGAAAAQSTIEIAATEEDEHQLTSSGMFFAKSEIAVQDGSAPIPLHLPLKFREGTIVGAIFSCDKAATVTASWFGWLENA